MFLWWPILPLHSHHTRHTLPTIINELLPLLFQIGITLLNNKNIEWQYLWNSLVSYNEVMQVYRILLIVKLVLIVLFIAQMKKIFVEQLHGLC